MSGIEEFRSAVVMSAQKWDDPLDQSDPNLVDVYQHALKLERGPLGGAPPVGLPSREKGVCIVEAVERNLICGSLIRDVPAEGLGDRAKALVEFLEGHGLIPSPTFTGVYVASLYSWHGCLNMAKVLRKTYKTATGESPYTLEQRWHGYDFVKSYSDLEERRGNPWVRFGVSIARLFEMCRGKRAQDIHDEWVPRDSPYWQG